MMIHPYTNWEDCDMTTVQLTSNLNKVERYDELHKLLLDRDREGLSFLSDIALLARAYRLEHDWETDQDPSATHEILYDIGIMLDRLRAVLA
jgi:hypothetical protein